MRSFTCKYRIYLFEKRFFDDKKCRKFLTLFSSIFFKNESIDYNFFVAFHIAIILLSIFYHIFLLYDTFSSFEKI